MTNKKKGRSPAKKQGRYIGKAPFDGYKDITREEERRLRRMSIKESARLTEILLREAKFWKR
jgi:hypothetical protein